VIELLVLDPALASTAVVTIVGIFPKCAVCHRETQTSQAQSSICLVRVLGELWDGDA
jgi:hypothetical protein